jgi:hypothetical protein
MNYFTCRESRLYAENIAVSAIAAAHGTPCYTYFRSPLENVRDFFTNHLLPTALTTG